MSNLKERKFLIFAPSYQELSGGVIALHKLCSILNELGRQSFLYPYSQTHSLKRNKSVKSGFDSLVQKAKLQLKPYKTNPFFETPVISNIKGIDWDKWVVIYPEVTEGNPLGAKNIVRWLLHNPGFHYDYFSYLRGELYFRFNSGISDFDSPGSCTSTSFLKVIHYPLEHYNEHNVATVRSGTAYSIRKGKGKPLLHSLKDSILIDEKPHKEVSEIFKRVKRFISYDSLSAYSIFAALCGCESVVVPDDGVSKEQWYPDHRDRYGISYGFADIEEANMSRSLLRDHILGEQAKCREDVKGALKEIDAYF